MSNRNPKNLEIVKLYWLFNRDQYIFNEILEKRLQQKRAEEWAVNV